MKLATFLLLFTAVAAFPQKKPITINRSLVEPDSVSVDVTIDKNAFGTCTCDLTRNACDAYCCCDTDCGAAILDVWNNDYNTNCAKNYIGQAFKPTQRCISSKQLYNYNDRMGMKVSDKQGLFCVEMDAASPTSSYQDYIPKYDDFVSIKSLEKHNMVNSLYAQKGY